MRRVGTRLLNCLKRLSPKTNGKGCCMPPRDPLGKFVSRTVNMKTLPGAADGEYDSSFEHKQSAVETVVPMLDKDGKWRISGYFIK